MDLDNTQEHYWKKHSEIEDTLNTLCKQTAREDWDELSMTSEAGDWSEDKYNTWKEECFYYYRHKIIEAGIHTFKEEE